MDLHTDSSAAKLVLGKTVAKQCVEQAHGQNERSYHRYLAKFYAMMVFQ